MRNNLARFVSGPVCRWLIIGLTAVAFTGLFLAKSGAHEAHEFPSGTKVGTVHAISAICDAYGVSQVAKANLEADNHLAGNRMFTKLAMADDPVCYGWGSPLSMVVKEVTYVGTSAGFLHVYIVEFGLEMYTAMTIRHAPETSGSDRIPRHDHGYDYGKDSV